MRRAIGWVWWRLLVLVPVLVWAFSDGPLGALLGWAVAGYLIWRAAPGIARDFGRLATAGPRGRRSRSGGEF
jgi:hypothetical protein